MFQAVLEHERVRGRGDPGRQHPGRRPGCVPRAPAGPPRDARHRRLCGHPRAHWVPIQSQTDEGETTLHSV